MVAKLLGVGAAKLGGWVFGKAGAQVAANKLAVEGGKLVAVQVGKKGAVQFIAPEAVAAFMKTKGARKLAGDALLNATKVNVPMLGAMSATRAAQLTGAATVAGGLVAYNQFTTPSGQMGNHQMAMNPQMMNPQMMNPQMMQVPPGYRGMYV